MELETINNVTSKWQEMTCTVLALKKISLSELQNLLKDTYMILTTYYKESLIPKEISKLLLEMDGFIHFITIVDVENVCIDFYHYQYISSIIDELKKGFFQGEYEKVFPELQVNINGTIFGISMEEAFLENLIDI